MNFIKKLFSSSEVVKDISTGVDKAFYTEQEKAGGFAMLLKLYEPFKIAQRIVLLLVGVPYMLMWSATGVKVLLGYNIDDEIIFLSGPVGTIFLTIAIFYYGGGALEGVVNRLKGDKK